MRQTDSEAELLGWVHDAADAGEPVVLNAGALTHTSVALRDACAELTAPLIEVHISNVHAREEFRHHSYLSAVATGVIVGLGVQGYLLALRYLAGSARTVALFGVRLGAGSSPVAGMRWRVVPPRRLVVADRGEHVGVGAVVRRRLWRCTGGALRSTSQRPIATPTMAKRNTSSAVNAANVVSSLSRPSA